MIYGFSTGSLAKGNTLIALAMMENHPFEAVELSALRECELPSLLASLKHLALKRYTHVSLHAPSRLETLREEELVEQLVEANLPVVVHPDVISNFALWQVLGPLLLIENMDKRKPTGRTACELDEIFKELPDARLCLDVGHARQIDPSLYEARRILKRHGHRVAEVHLSDVNSSSGHERLNRPSIEAFQELVHLIPNDIPVILETPVPAEEIAWELEKAREIFSARQLATA